MSSQPLKFNKQLLLESKEKKFQDFHNLMSFRIRNIIVISSMYDYYLFEEDGRLYELIRKEFQGLNLSNSPELIHVSTGKEAIEILKKEGRFNLVIISLHVFDIPPIKLAKRIKKLKGNIPVALLGFKKDELELISNDEGSKNFDKIFMWQGDFRIIFGIIKYFEDKFNVDEDIKRVGVQVILMVEDSVKFYSSNLPLVYTEVVKQAQRIVAEGINLSHRFLRMRARPKIILCSNYEEVYKYYNKYQDNILGILASSTFKKKGILRKNAGFILTKNIKNHKADLPILILSNSLEDREKAYTLGASFVYKKSPVLLEEIKLFMNQQFSFGDFIFRLNNGTEIARASNLIELENQLKVIPDESLKYHSLNNHFSNWLKARTDFWLAYQLRPRKVDQYNSVHELRFDLINAIKNYNKDRQRGIISDFDSKTFNESSFFSRIGGGSIGGKARGLSFFSKILSNFDISNKYNNVDIFVPSTVVLATNIFDQFMEENGLTKFALETNDDELIKNRFIEAEKFPYRALKNLIKFLKKIKRPLAVRSSSLVEDSQGQPFAGVYETIMLPNNSENSEIRLKQLVIAIKQVYASIYYQKAKQYMSVTSYHLEEEKMAVIIQEMVGGEHNLKFYPEISGVAKSYNFYPVRPMVPEDGIVSVAFGLGKTIVDGGNTIKFCPRYPKKLILHSNIDEVLDSMQTKYFAIDMSEKDGINLDSDGVLVENEVNDAFKEGTLDKVGSTYSPQSNTIYDGTSRDGLKIFSMAPILKYKTLPVAEILDLILKISSWGISNPVEIEFAVNLSVPKSENAKFAVLQMRPLVVSNELVELNLSKHNEADLICKSNNALGNGVVNNIKDIIFVDINSFERAKSNETAKNVGYFNAKLAKNNLEYLLIGIGRWGTLDPWLGIPITWEQISGAKAIVESNFKNFDVEPSQGSHFFQNLTSFKVGYFTVNNHIGNGFIDWDWLLSQNISEMRGDVKHIKLENPITIKINGREKKGIILKPQFSSKQ